MTKKEGGPSMKVAVFSTKSYDRTFLEAANRAHGHVLFFLEPRLTHETVPLASGYRPSACSSTTSRMPVCSRNWPVIVYAFTQRHRGRLEIESEPGHGARFKMWFPAVPEQRTAGRAQSFVTYQFFRRVSPTTPSSWPASYALIGLRR
jgi:hypothetical protein